MKLRIENTNYDGYCECYTSAKTVKGIMKNFALNHKDEFIVDGVKILKVLRFCRTRTEDTPLRTIEIFNYKKNKVEYYSKEGGLILNKNPWILVKDVENVYFPNC